MEKSNEKNRIIPVILCGGSGSRLWPLSRGSFPKQFLSILPNKKHSLLQETLERLNGIKNLERPILICNEEHRFIVAEQMREINIKPLHIILEPFGRNTAPAIAIAALKSLEDYQNPNLLILSSDHHINENKKFHAAVKKGVEFAENGRLVTFGVVPTSPDIGFGYIESDNPFNVKQLEGLNIKRFIEKPELDTAKKLFKNKKFTWNSGIFAFKAKTILSELKIFNPKIINFCQESIKNKSYDLDFLRLEKSSFKNCPNISIDYAVMEKTKLGTVVPLDAGWSDIGSWNSAWKLSDKDKAGNVKEGKVHLKDSVNCFMRGENRLIVGLGLKDLIVIETNDAILIANRNDDQKVKEIVEELKIKGFKEGINHSKTYRPWGYYLSVLKEDRWQVKLILVKPGEKLSLQMHYHRSEHWVVVSGTALVEIDGKASTLGENESAYIPLRSIHRLSNPGRIPLLLIEVQSGSYVGEDDIKRIKDSYGR